MGYYNCYEYIIVDILEKNEINSAEFFNKSGLAVYVDKKEGDKNLDVFFSSRENLYEEELAQNYNLNLIPIKANTNNLVTQIDDLLKNKKKIIGAVDTFYLPYCRSYQKEHYFHFIQVEERDTNNYFITDNYYGYQGKINKEIVASYMREGIKIGDFHFLYYDPKEIKINDTDNKIKKTIKHNYNLLTDIKYYKNTSNADLYIGLNALIKTQELIHIAYDNKDFDLIDKISTGITQITHTRRHFYDYLNSLNIEDLRLKYFECYQKWQILQNFLLKVVFLNSFQAAKLNNISKSIYEVEKAERKCIQSLMEMKD
ncbi:hypothetical protein WR52_30380 (plasmid) [Bacillus cereus]|uniref:DUF6005 family protein n=1 Tax=Bacillus cereus TaxID=1396 RepID=UPI0007B6C650|nr:DUF6005 family protein [Bacillus cereus]ANC23016.1 hypothetical protein WR52_30380 [Bacillus cereus]